MGERERKRERRNKRERESHRCTDREIGRKIGSEGAPVVRVKGELGLEKGLREWGGWEPRAIFFPFMKIGSGPVIIPTE